MVEGGTLVGQKLAYEKRVYMNERKLIFFKKIFIWLCCVLVVACGIFFLRHVGSSSLIRDQSQVSCIGSIES